ncbi:MAG: hypothetical protein JXP34_06000 [Planctomycetes bacterium]|nr:hypothetical protein [Planctomycetota bacterium]
MSDTYRRFGDVALDLKLVNAEQLAQALSEQAERRLRGRNVLLGQILLEHGAIDDKGIRTVLDVLYPVQNIDG